MRKKSVPEFDTASVESALGYTFSDKHLLIRALTHRSFLNEHDADGHNERLEFLGDAVLQLISTEDLFERYPDKSEGMLSVSRSQLVRTEFLAEVAKELGIAKYLRTSIGQAKELQENENLSLYANTIEAIIGAIYRDSGLPAARSFVFGKVLTDIPGFLSTVSLYDSKTVLQELAQRQQKITPTYTTIRAVGPDNDRVFTIGVRLGDTIVGTGEGRTKQEAAQRAAYNALQSGAVNLE